VVLGSLAVLTVANSVGVALAPALLMHAPLWLLALSPLDRHLVVVATRVDLLTFMLVALPARMLGAFWSYVVGYGYGEQGLVWVETRRPRLGRYLRWLERGFQRAAMPLLFLWPRPLGCALAGAVHMPMWRFAIAATAGQAAWIALTYRLGEKLAPKLEPMIAFFREHMLSTTIACVLAVVLYRLLRRSRREVIVTELVANERTGEGG
jgi:membrane protein DedA with SNARE-associated domain